MRFGVCANFEQLPLVRAAGWDFLEESVPAFLRPDNEDWTPPAAALGEIPIIKNLVPAALKIVGPAADAGKLHSYMQRICARAAQVGARILVFGSGAARNIPPDFPRQSAHQQLLAFSRTAADLAASHGLTIVVENLNAKETNVLNTLAEVIDFVREVDRPNFRALADLYHMWMQNEPLDILPAALPFIRHIHLADLEGRVAPGLSGKSDYRPFFRLLKSAAYPHTLSAEAKFLPDLPTTVVPVLAFLKQQWEQA